MMLLQAQLQPLHSLTNGGGAVTGIAMNGRLLLTKAYLCNVLQLLKYRTTIHHKESTVSYNILSAVEKPNTIVSLCLDKKKKKRRTNHSSMYRGHSSVLTMSCISYKIPKQSPYTPWQYKCSHNGKNKI